MQFHNYFPVCVAQIKLDDELVNKMEESIVPQLHLLSREKPISDSVGDPYTALDSMDTDFWENKVLVHELVPEFWEVVSNHAKEYSEHTSIMMNENVRIRYWTQDYKDKDYHDIHAHGVHGISGTYYVRANENAGPIRFYNPNPVAELVRAGNPGNQYCRAHNDIWPERGNLLLFPSYIKHQVLACNEGAIRTSISFNFCPGV